MKPWGCWTDGPMPHPWEPISDTACGFDERLSDPRCQGCHRSREEGPLDQLAQIYDDASEDGRT